MKRSLRCTGRRTAVTLIEVVVALVLLATLVTGMVTAYSAHYRQALLASRRQDAIQAADRLLAQWYASADPQVPRSSFGILPGASTYVWRTEIVHRSVIESLPVEVVRLRVFSSSAVTPSGQLKTTELRDAPAPLAQVDVILPVPENRL